LGTACPLSGRNSTYRPVQISGTGSVIRGEFAGNAFRKDFLPSEIEAARTS